MSRRILSILLVILLLPFVPLEAKATEYTDQGFAYEVTDGEAKVIYNSNSNYGAHITIPETLGGYPVTTIGDGAFWYRTEVNTVTLPASVKKLEDAAFFNAGIYDINIENVEYFGSDCLGNVYMTELHFPDGAFINAPVMKAPDLEKITIGDNSVVTDFTFADKTSTDQYGQHYIDFGKVNDIVIGNNVTIGTRSFSSLDSLKRVVIGDGTSIGGSCFSSVPVLDTVVLGNVTAIGGEEATDVFIGVYNASGRLVKVDRADFSNTVTFEDIPSGMQIKAFLWNNQIPLCQTATVKTPDNLY